MDIQCRSCDATIKVPDGKVPKDKPFVFECPSCGNKITGRPPKETEPRPETLKAAAVQAPPPPAIADNGDDEGMENVDTALFDTVRFAPGKINPGAIICHTEPDKLLGIAKGAGLDADKTTSHSEAMKLLRYNEYGVVIVTAEFEKIPRHKASVLDNIKSMTMDTRRKFFVVLISGEADSFTPIQAAANSVNMMVSWKDIQTHGAETVGKVVKDALKQHDLEYRIYNESLYSIGKR